MGMWLSDLFSLVFVPNIYEAALPEDESIVFFFLCLPKVAVCKEGNCHPARGFERQALCHHAAAY